MAKNAFSYTLKHRYRLPLSRAYRYRLALAMSYRYR